MNGRSPDVRNAEGVFIHCIVTNRHDGQSFFALAPSAGSPHPPSPALREKGQKGGVREICVGCFNTRSFRPTECVE